MLKLILIDDDERFMTSVQGRFQDRAQIYTSNPQEPCKDGMKLVEDHPGAYVFIDLHIRDKHNNQPRTCAVDLAAVLVERKVAPQHLRFCSNDLSAEVPREVLEKMLHLKIQYVDKSRLVEEIEELLRAADRSLPRTRRRRRDEKWFLGAADLRRQYAGQVVAVADRKVWGSGADVAAALQVAQSQPGCPPLDDLLLAVVPDDEPAFFPLLPKSSEQDPNSPHPPVPHTNA